LSKIEQPAAQL